MEFKRGNFEYRNDRRICPTCTAHSAEKTACPTCGRATKPRIRLVWYINGERYRRLTDQWREDRAQQILQIIEEDYWRQQRLGISRAPGGTLDTAIEAFGRSKAEMSTKWQAQLRAALYPLRDGLGADYEVMLIERDDVRAYLADGLHAHSPSTMRSYMVVLRCLFRYLLQEGWIRIDPTRSIKLPKARERQDDYLPPEHVGPVLDACWSVAPDFAPIAMAITLGSFRKGEVVNLRRDGLDLTERWVNVVAFQGDASTPAWSPKTDSSRRSVPLHPLLAETLGRLEPVKRADGTVSPWIFPITSVGRTVRTIDRHGHTHLAVGDRRSPKTNHFGHCLRRALAEAGIERHVTIHGLRRTFAVLLQDAGAPDSVIRQAMGHTPCGVTEQHYLPRRDPLIKRWIDRIRIKTTVAELPRATGEAISEWSALAATMH